MTDSTAEPADFLEHLAERTLADEAERQRNIRRALTGLAVFLLHAIAIAVFIVSIVNKVPVVERVRATVPEAIWILMPPPHPPVHKLVPLPQPQTPVIVAPVITAPITVPQSQSHPLSRPKDEGLLGIGRSLACGASSYENLSPLEREECRRHPWHFVKKPDGTIVLEAPLKPVIPPPTAADVIRHEMQTAPPCPILNNTPCLGKIIHGDPLGGGPQPF